MTPHGITGLERINSSISVTCGLQCEFRCSVDGHVIVHLIWTSLLKFVLTALHWLSVEANITSLKKSVLRHRQLEHLVAKLIG
jgi:hypothetical protein